MAIEISSGGLCPSNARPGVFPNFAGRPDIDDACAAELEAAGIKSTRLECLRDDHPEVKTSIRGELHGWLFTRCWYYWAAKGPGVPPEFANPLYRSHGRQARVMGDCACRSPEEWCKGFAVGSYHVDTPEGLRALADTLKAVADSVSSKAPAEGE